MNTTKLAQLLGSASVVAFAYAGAVSAQAVPESIDFFADYGDTYENIIDLDYDEFWDMEAEVANTLISEGALGAINSDFSQTTVNQFVNVSAETDSEDDTLIDLSHFIELDEKTSDADGLTLGSFNLATAHTTSFDALLEGSQVAQSSFNTASLDITDAGGEDDLANVALLQIFDGANGEDFMSSTPYYGYDVDISAVNIMDAAAAYAGTATIDGQTLDEDEELVNGIQQAAVSLNTFRLESEVDTTIELAGQYLDTPGITDGEDYLDAGEDGYFSLDAYNIARAYAPAPATSDLVDPRLATDLNDPSINNLDQIAAISINTISLGNAQVGTAQVGTAAVGVEGEDGYVPASEDFVAASDDFVAASDTDFTIYAYSNDGGEDGYGANSYGQELRFDYDTSEIGVGNLMLATTSEFLYDVSGEDNFGPLGDTGLINLDMEEYDGVGDVAINSASQAAVLTFNSVRNAGIGDLTLKEVYATGGEDYTSAAQEDFDQDLDNFQYSTYGENIAVAMTGEGAADISGLEQIVQYGVNSISSGGAVLSWNDDQTGIQQEIDSFEYDFYGEDSAQMQFASLGFTGEFSSPGMPDYDLDMLENRFSGVNTASAITKDGDADASDVMQVLQMSVNTISAGGDVTASLEQNAEDSDDPVEVDFDGTINAIVAASTDPYSSRGMGNATIDTAEQMALFTFNSLSADGALTTDYADQHFDGDDFDFTAATLNSALALAPYGDAEISGVDQIGQFALNTVSAGSFIGSGDDPEEEDLHQRIDALDELDRNDSVFMGNRLEALSATYGRGTTPGFGDASISDSSQAFILNANSVRVDGTISGFIEQDINTDTGWDDLQIGNGDVATNVVYALANQDMNDARWVGGNASITGLTQTLSMSFNSVSAGSLDGATIVQDISHVNINVGNSVYADAEWGAASITGVSQTTINRMNSISITPPSLDN